MTAEREIVDAATEVGILGFNPHTDAIRQRTSEGPRIWYLRDDEIRWCGRERRPQRRWTAPATSSGEGLASTLEAADEYRIIDKCLHNALVSGPFRNKAVHEGIAWGVVLMFGSQLRRGDFPWSHSYTSIPGVGDATAREISAGLAGYEDSPSFGGESPEKTTEESSP